MISVVPFDEYVLFDNYKSNYEGIHYNNLYATYNLGPLLIRNPILKDHIIKEILEKEL